MDELQRVAERMMRAEIAALPDGVYTFTDYIDGVGDEPEPIPICVRVEIAGDEVIVDFAGTRRRSRRASTAPSGMVYAACLLRHSRHRRAARSRTARATSCRSGSTRLPGTVVNPVLPAACGARGVIGYRVYDAVMGALAPFVPDRVIAAGEGGRRSIALRRVRRRHRARPFGTTEVLVGTWGARPSLDGLEGVSNPLANSATSRSS